MKSKTFTGKDKPDLDRQIWNWRSANSHMSVKKIHPMEDLPLRLHKPHVQFGKIKPSLDPSRLRGLNLGRHTGELRRGKPPLRGYKGALNVALS